MADPLQSSGKKIVHVLTVGAAIAANNARPIHAAFRLGERCSSAVELCK